MILYHFTCRCCRAAIGRTGRLLPSSGDGPLSGLVWFTSDPDSAREDLGLTSLTLDCDRMACRYRTRSGGGRLAVPWLASSRRAGLPPAIVAVLEGPYTRPDIWWVAEQPVYVRLSRVRPDWDPSLSRLGLARRVS